jgi:hypothetical protein
LQCFAPGEFAVKKQQVIYLREALRMFTN